jgi:glutamate-5-semialdehyde dehydrogenase
MNISDLVIKASAASKEIAGAGTTVKNNILLKLKDILAANAGKILTENAKDIDNAAKKGTKGAFLERLTLSQKKIDTMIEGIDDVIKLSDPIGLVLSGWRRPNGLQINKVSVPLGTIGIVYESRPNVTIDAAILCIKSGNATVLKGGSEAINSNRILTNCIREAIQANGLNPDIVCFIDSTERNSIDELMGQRKYVDAIIPRGGAGLIDYVVSNSKVPVIETGTGNCHIYVHEAADIEMARKIVINAKTQRPGVCNAAEKLLIDRSIIDKLPLFIADLKAKNVELLGCPEVHKLDKSIPLASEQDWYEEYLELKMAIKVVDNLSHAIDHINKYNSKHSESIMTTNYDAGQEFCERIDAAALYINASTRFTDGFEYGFGAEIGISNQKIHARGPMGLMELTTYKYIVRGNGQIKG